MTEWAEQSRTMARRLALLLRSNYEHAVEATPIVITSGTELLILPPDLEGTAVVRRRHVGGVVQGWRQRSSILSRYQVEDIREALLDYRATREAH